MIFLYVIRDSNQKEAYRETGKGGTRQRNPDESALQLP